MEIVIFILFAVVAVACGINVVLQSHPISSALSLVGVMASLAVLYLQLGAEFIAMAQIIVYAGAIMVLFIFVIMLLNAGSEERGGRSWTAQVLGIPALAAFFGIVCYYLLRGYGAGTFVKFGGFQGGTAQDVGYALFTDYLLPFEATSVLILVAIVGAIVLARKELD